MAESQNVDWSAQDLEPEAIRASLMLAGLFITGFELLKLSIIEGVKSFHVTGFRNGTYFYTSEYEERIAAASYTLDASTDWLVERGVLDESDANTLGRIRKHRNEVAHELPYFAISYGKQLNIQLLIQARDILDKIDTFWARLPASVHPQFDNVEPNDTKIISGRVLIFDHLLSTVVQLTEDDNTGARRTD